MKVFAISALLLAATQAVKLNEQDSTLANGLDASIAGVSTDFDVDTTDFTSDIVGQAPTDEEKDEELMVLFEDFKWLINFERLGKLFFDENGAPISLDEDTIALLEPKQKKKLTRELKAIDISAKIAYGFPEIYDMYSTLFEGVNREDLNDVVSAYIDLPKEEKKVLKKAVKTAEKAERKMANKIAKAIIKSIKHKEIKAFFKLIHTSRKNPDYDDLISQALLIIESGALEPAKIGDELVMKVALLVLAIDEETWEFLKDFEEDPQVKDFVEMVGAQLDAYMDMEEADLKQLFESFLGVTTTTEELTELEKELQATFEIVLA